jgi:hypothetical protein
MPKKTKKKHNSGVGPDNILYKENFLMKVNSSKFVTKLNAPHTKIENTVYAILEPLLCLHWRPSCISDRNKKQTL